MIASHVEPMLNKFACITKERTGGAKKLRIITDSMRSSMTEASRKMYRAVLMLTWTVLGVASATRIGQFGLTIDWNGAGLVSVQNKVSTNRLGSHAGARHQRTERRRHKDLRSFVGEVQSLASLL